VNTPRRERQEAGGFAARLRQVLPAQGSASALARTIARSEGALRKWLRGESEPNVTDLRALSQATRTRIEWLVTGEGERQMPAHPDPGSAVLDSPRPHHHSSRGSLDLPLLEAVLSAVEEQLRASGGELSVAKRSALIAAAYDHARERSSVDPQALARLVKLAR